MHRVSAAVLALGLAASLAGTALADEFTLTSPDIAEGATIAEAHVFAGFGCTGGNISPALTWIGAPEGTKSFALTVYDPDAPTGSGWWHWIMFNIPADVTSLPQGAGSEGGTLPDGAIQSRTDYGAPGYGGPCPPEGAAPHHYEFKIHALSVDSLPLDADASGALVGFMVNANSLGTAQLTAIYGR